MCCVLMVLSVDRDFVVRLFRPKGKGKQGTQPENFTDPLEEVYFQTLVGPKTPMTLKKPDPWNILT